MTEAGRAFGLALPEISAATKIWRRMYDSEEQLSRDVRDFIREPRALGLLEEAEVDLDADDDGVQIAVLEKEVA